MEKVIYNNIKKINNAVHSIRYRHSISLALFIAMFFSMWLSTPTGGVLATIGVLWTMVIGVVAGKQFTFSFLSSFDHWLTLKKKDNEVEEALPSSLSPYAWYVSILIIAIVLMTGGETKEPITNLHGIYINKPITDEVITKSGLVTDNAKILPKGEYILIDPDNQNTTYHIYSNPENNTVYKVVTNIELVDSNERGDLIDDITWLWDKKYGGGNLGNNRRYYKDIRLDVDDQEETLSVIITMSDVETRAAVSQIEKEAARESMQLSTLRD